MYNLLILVVVILGVLAVALMIRTYELSKKLTGRREDIISEKDNELMSKIFPLFLVVYFAGLLWIIFKWHWAIPEAGSLNGQTHDFLRDTKYIIIGIAFFLTNSLLFIFARVYRRKKGVKAYYFPHNTALELVWTIVPSAVLAVGVVVGLRAWHQVMSNPSPEAINIEIFSEQFKWTVRYSGKDNVLGKHDYKLTTDNNPLGLITSTTLDNSIKLMETGTDDGAVKGLDDFEKTLNNKNVVMSVEGRDALNEKFHRQTRLLRLLYQMRGRHDVADDKFAMDDVIETDTLHMIVNKEYEIALRAKDVIHSFYMPHFRAQMNTVPGMTTRFKITPVFTTAEMRKRINNDKFHYVIMCNKVCGSAHYKMRMICVVQTQEEFDDWMSTKKTFGQSYDASLSAPAATDSTAAEGAPKAEA